ncbi:MAG TPA: maleylacetate reductase [Gemmatimonadaceae bacterium]
MRPDGFVYDARAPRIVFGAGSRSAIARECERLGMERALVVCTPGRLELVSELQQLAAGRIGGVFAHARQHVPTGDLDAAKVEEASAGTDGYLAIGGGSATGFAKALALQSGLPIIALPTTYSGSEMTPVWGITEAGRKITGRDDRVLPRTVIYDAELTLTLTAEVAGPSGLNAMAHCVGALGAPDADPITSLLAEEGIRLMSAALPVIARTPEHLAARSDAMYAACLAGLALGATRMGLHHRLAHLLGGTLGLPHAETHAVLLPQTVSRGGVDSPDAMARIARALGTGDAARALHDLAGRIGAPRSLRELGMREDQLPQVVAAAAAMERERGGIWSETRLHDLLQAAFTGRAPDPDATARIRLGEEAQ